MKTLHAWIGAALAVSATCSCLAQVTYNRTISGVALTSNGDGSQILMIVFTVEATSAPVVKATEGGPVLDDVSTTASVLINGAAIANIPFCIQVDPGTIFGGPCGGACGSGIVNGMSAALLCIDGQCQSPPITSNIPVPAIPCDEIMVLLRTAPGALPELPGYDDDDTAEFPDGCVTWGRCQRRWSCQRRRPRSLARQLGTLLPRRERIFHPPNQARFQRTVYATPSSVSSTGGGFSSKRAKSAYDAGG